MATGTSLGSETVNMHRTSLVVVCGYGGHDESREREEEKVGWSSIRVMTHAVVCAGACRRTVRACRSSATLSPAPTASRTPPCAYANTALPQSCSGLHTYLKAFEPLGMLAFSDPFSMESPLPTPHERGRPDDLVGCAWSCREWLQPQAGFFIEGELDALRGNVVGGK